MCSTPACKTHEVSWSDFMHLIVDSCLTVARKNIDTFFFVEVPMIFGGLVSWLERYEVKAKLTESGHFAERPLETNRSFIQRMDGALGLHCGDFGCLQQCAWLLRHFRLVFDGYCFW